MRFTMTLFPFGSIATYFLFLTLLFSNNILSDIYNDRENKNRANQIERV